MTLTVEAVLAPRPSWHARVQQYQDGVELVLVKRRALDLVDLALVLSALGLGGVALVLLGPELGPWWALAFWLCGLLGAGSMRDVGSHGLCRRRALFAHGASETFVLAGARPTEHLGGGACQDLLVAVEHYGPDTCRLRLFTASGEHDLGGPVLLPAQEAVAIRRFVALSGIQAVGLH